MSTTTFDIEALAWDKQGGLLPAIVQDAATLRVLMLGYMDRAALRETLRATRADGFATEDSEVTLGFRSVGVAVRDHARWPVAAIARAKKRE